MVIANLAERGNVTFLARSALSRSLCIEAPRVLMIGVLPHAKTSESNRSFISRFYVNFVET